MKTAATTALLTIMFLSAGAFAGNPPTHPSAKYATGSNLTVVKKNQLWPLAFLAAETQ